MLSFLWSFTINCALAVEVGDIDESTRLGVCAALDAAGSTTLKKVGFARRVPPRASARARARAGGGENRSEAPFPIRPPILLPPQFYFAAFHKMLPGACKLVIKFLLLVVLAAIIAFLLAKADSAILAEVGASFIPVWLAGRMTEVFKLGTLWGFKVQYGSSRGLGLL